MQPPEFHRIIGIAVALLLVSDYAARGAEFTQPLEFDAENTNNLGGVPSFDVARSWPGILFEQDGCKPIEALEAIVHFEVVEGSLDVRGHEFELLVFNEEDYWSNRSASTRIHLGKANTEFTKIGTHYFPSQKVAVGSTGARNGNETTYRFRWMLKEDNFLTKKGRYAVIFLATHGETEFGATKLNFFKPSDGEGNALPVPIYSLEGSGVQNPVDRKIAFDQVPGQIEIGFALQFGSVKTIYRIPEPVLQIKKTPTGIAFHFETVHDLRYSLESSTELTEWTQVDTIVGKGSPTIFHQPMIDIRTFYRLKISPFF